MRGEEGGGEGREEIIEGPPSHVTESQVTVQNTNCESPRLLRASLTITHMQCVDFARVHERCVDFTRGV